MSKKCLKRAGSQVQKSSGHGGFEREVVLGQMGDTKEKNCRKQDLGEKEREIRELKGICPLQSSLEETQV